MSPVSNRQSGSAFFIILIAIMMFAVLTYAVSRSGSTNEKNLTDSQAKMAAQEIISYGNALADTVQKLRLRGCTDIELDFSGGGSKKGNGTIFPYSNTNAPADGSCNVFSMNGGKMMPPAITMGTITPSLPDPSWMHSQSFFVSASRVAGVGNDSTTDLLFWFGRLTKETCYEINKILGINLPTGATTPDTFNCNGTSFNGSYPSCTDPIGDVNTSLVGKTAFCNELQNDGFNYTFHQVLLAR